MRLNRTKGRCAILILSRRLNERIRILTKSGEVIWVNVVDLDRSKVRLGIVADKSILISREELLSFAERPLQESRP